MDEWMDEWMDGWMDGLDEWIDGNGLKKALKTGRIEGWVSEVGKLADGGLTQ